MRVRQFGRLQVVDHLSVFGPWQSGVWRAEQGGLGVGGQISQRFVHEVRAGRTVQADALEPKGRQRGQRRADLAANQHLAAGLNRDRCEQRSVALELGQCVLAGEDRRFALEQVVDRLDQQRIDAAIEQTAGLFEIRGVQLVKADVSQRRQLRAGAQRTEHVTGMFRGRVLIRNEASNSRRLAVDLSRPLRQIVLGQRDCRSAEGVGQYGIRSGFEIRRVQRCHGVGAREIEDLVAALKAVEVGERQVEQLQTGSGRAVEHDHPLSSSRAEVGTLHPLIVSSKRRRGSIARTVRRVGHILSCPAPWVGRPIRGFDAAVRRQNRCWTPPAPTLAAAPASADAHGRGSADYAPVETPRAERRASIVTLRPGVPPQSVQRMPRPTRTTLLSPPARSTLISRSALVALP